MFYLFGKFRTPSPGDSISVALRKVFPLEHGSGNQAAYKFTAKGTGSLNIKDYCEVKKKINRYKVREFSFLHIGRCKPLGSLNSLLSYVPQLSGPNPVSLFTLSSGSCGRWLPLEFPQLLSNHHGGWITMAGGSPWPVDHHGGWRHLLD